MTKRIRMPIDSSMVLLPACLALLLAACAPGSTKLHEKSEAQVWEETLRQVEVLKTVETEFASTHRFKGQPVQAAMDRLTGEGFDCALQYKEFPALKKGSLDKFTIEIEPMIYCSKPHVQTGPDDKCHTFWAAFHVHWQDAARPPEILKREFATSAVEDETYFCRISPGTY